MAELVSAYPTAGGIYWWASKLGGPAWGWFTGWFNLLGLIAHRRLGRLLRRRSSSASCSASTTSTCFGLNFGDAAHGLRETFLLFALILDAARVHQHPRQPPRRDVQRHLRVLARRRRRGDRRDPRSSCPTTTRASTSVFTDRINNSGFGQSMFWWYVLPLGFLLTQYTITGFDASAHISEETHDADERRAQGRLALGLLLGGRSATSCCWRSRSPPPTRPRSPRAAARSLAVFLSRDDARLGEGRSSSSPSIGQLFCGMSCMTSCVAHDVRVLARRRGAGLAALEQGQRRSGSRSTRSSPSRCSR